MCSKREVFKGFQKTCQCLLNKFFFLKQVIHILCNVVVCNVDLMDADLVHLIGSNISLKIHRGDGDIVIYIADNVIETPSSLSQ